MYEELINKLRKMRDVSSGLSALLPKSGGDVVANLYGEAADAIEELSREIDIDNAAMTAMDAAMPRWIPVTERIPKGADASGEICENVNLLLDDGLVTCGWMNGITDKVYYINVRDDYIQKAPITRVTHWMPLPEPPKRRRKHERTD